MTRDVFTLVCFALCSTAIIGANALAASAELSRCLDPSTTLEAGGNVSDKELKAAQSACAELKQTSLDYQATVKVKAATETIDEEVKRRGAAGH
jgi:hypothetical protein